MRRGTTAIITGLALALLLLPVAQASALTGGQAKRAASQVVRASASYKQMASSYRLKVSSCHVSSNQSAVCRLFRSAPNPCSLNGPAAPDQVCANTVAYRAWTVRVSASGNNTSAVVTGQRDVVGQFEPSS